MCLAVAIKTSGRPAADLRLQRHGRPVLHARIAWDALSLQGSRRRYYHGRGRDGQGDPSGLERAGRKAGWCRISEATERVAAFRCGAGAGGGQKIFCTRRFGKRAETGSCRALPEGAWKRWLPGSGPIVQGTRDPLLAPRRSSAGTTLPGRQRSLAPASEVSPSVHAINDRPASWLPLANATESADEILAPSCQPFSGRHQ